MVLLRHWLEHISPAMTVLPNLRETSHGEEASAISAIPLPHPNVTVFRPDIPLAVTVLPKLRETSHGEEASAISTIPLPHPNVTVFRPDMGVIEMVREFVAKYPSLPDHDVGRHIYNPDLLEQAARRGDSLPLLGVDAVAILSGGKGFHKDDRRLVVHVYHNVTVNGVGMIQGYRAAYQGCFWPGHNDLKAADLGVPKVVKEDVVVLSQLFGNQVYHFVAENLARLAYVFGSTSPRWDPALVTFHVVRSGVKEFAFDTRMEFLRLVAGNSNVKVVSGKIYAHTAIYPPNVRCLFVGRQEAWWLRARLRRMYQSTTSYNVASAAETQRRICIILRHGQREDEFGDVETIARDAGFKVIKTLGKGTVQNQASCFFNADATAGSHGAGEVFMFFAPRLSTLVELFLNSSIGPAFLGFERFRYKQCYMYLALHLELH